MCILFVYTLLKKSVSYYDLSVLSMSVMDLPKKGGILVELSPFCLGFLDFFKTLLAPKTCRNITDGYPLNLLRMYIYP